MAMFALDDTGGDAADRVNDLFGPAQVDQSGRQAVQFCWASLSRGRRTPAELEAQFRRLVDRAYKDFLDDRRAFGQDDRPAGERA